jgi:hypothetical protein
VNRAERRARAVLSRELARERPATLTPVPWAEWPECRIRPTSVWISRDYLVQLFAEPAVFGTECKRLTVNRTVAGGDGYFDERSKTGFCASAWMSAANARLMAAAPAMLGKLRELAVECLECGGNRWVTRYDVDLGGGFRGDADDQPCSGCEDIWAVIDAAEGRS